MHKPIQDLIVHIGLEKTGTTSIQSFLAMNHARLAEMGVFVPQSVGHENHKFLAAAAFRPGSDDVAVTSCGVGPSACDVATFRTDVLNAVLKEASAANATRALFSSEDLSRLFHADEIDTAMQMFETVASQVTILVFLRRQDLLATSRYYSLLLGGAQYSQILPASGEVLPRYYDYLERMDLWAERAGADNIKIVTFPERPSEAGFDSISAYCNAVGLLDKALLRPERRHVSLDAVNQLILHQFNQAQDVPSVKAIEAFAAQLAPMNDRRFSQIVSQTQAKDFYARVASNNAKMFERFGQASAPFGDDFSMYPEENMRLHFQALAIRRLISLKSQ